MRIAVVVAAFLTIVAFWAVLDHGEDRRGEGSGPVERAAPAGSPVPERTGPSPGPTLMRTVPWQEPVATETVPASEGGIDVVVLDAAGQPMPGALVHFLEGASWRGWEELQGGRAFRCDDAGQTRVPLPENGAWVGARQGGSSDRARVLRGHFGDVILRLEPERWIRVRTVVFHAGGEPAAGLPVVLGEFGMFDRVIPLARGTTGADGRGLLEVEERDVQQFGRTIPLVVEVQAPFFDLLPQAVTPNVLAGEELRIDLRPAAAVRVHAIMPDGTPASPPVEVFLKEVNMTQNPRPHRRAIRVVDDTGSALFPAVPSGSRIQAVVQDLRGWLPPRTEVFDAPAAGGFREISVRFEEFFPVVEGRLVRANGEPAAAVRLEYEWRRKSGWSGGRNLTTDDAGRFRFPITGPYREPVRAVGFTTGADAGWMTSWNLEPRVSETGMDLGDVMLVEAPILASGVVVDPEGRPIPDVSVWTSARAPYMIRRSFPATDAGGRFVLYGDWMDPTVRLAASDRKDIPQKDLEVPVGSLDVRLVCRPCTQTIQVGLLLDGGIVATDLFPRIFPPDGGPGDAREDVMVHGRERDVTVKTGMQGRCELRIYGRPSGFLLHVARLVLAPGRETTCEIDLRGRLHGFAFHVTERGRRLHWLVDQLHVETTDPDNGRPIRLSGVGASGVFRAVATAPTLEVTIRAKDRPSVTCTVTPSDGEVDLERFWPIRLGLDTHAARPSEWVRPSEPVYLEPVLTPVEGGEPVRPAAGPRRYHDHWVCNVYMPRPGRYRVAYELSTVATGSRNTVQLADTTPSLVDIQDVRREQGWQVAIPASALDAALQRLR